jgi:hypothetical protein
MEVVPLFNYDIDIGKKVETIVKNEVIQSIDWRFRYANQLDDNRSEFYEGAAAGIKPEFTFEINDFEYDSENFLRYPSGNGTIYTIIRAPKRGEMRELVCTTLAGVHENG